jgi:NTP pyrophosphatase (non-canonical NTP hydrolase)
MSEGLNDKAKGTVLKIAVPAELVAIGVGPDLQRFFDAMIYKLRRNAHKGRWVDVGLQKAFDDLRGETAELRQVIRTGSTSEVLMEAADVANEALIIANIALEAKGV